MKRLKDLLSSVHCEGVPNWTTSQTNSAYKFLEECIDTYMSIHVSELYKHSEIIRLTWRKGQKLYNDRKLETNRAATRGVIVFEEILECFSVESGSIENGDAELKCKDCGSLDVDFDNETYADCQIINADCVECGNSANESIEF